MWRRYQEPLLPFGQLPVILLCVMVIGFALLMFPKRKKVILSIGTVIAAWQGGLWVGYIAMDIRLFHLMFLGLLLWNLSDSPGALRRWRAQLKPLLPWVLLIVWSLVSVSVALDASTARKGPARFLVDMIFFLAIITTIRTAKDFRFFIMCIAAAIIGQSIFAMLQFKFPGITFGVIDDIRTHMWWRARGTFRHPNHLGMMLVMLLPIMIRGVISGMVTRDRRLMQVCGVAALFGATAVLTTYNRGAWVGLAFGCFVMIALDLLEKRGRIRKYAQAFLAISVIVGVIGLMKFGDFIVTRMFYDDQEQILEGRQSLSQEGLQVFYNHPIRGVGYGNEHLHASVSFVHNLYILIAAELGLPGILFFLWFLFRCFKMIVRTCRSKIPFVKNYGHGLLASLAGFVVASIPGPDFWINDGVQIYFFAVVAVLAGVHRIEQRSLMQKKQDYLKQKRQRMATSASATALENKGIAN